MKRLFYSLIAISVLNFGCSSEKEGTESTKEEASVKETVEETKKDPPQEVVAPVLEPGEYVKISTYYGDMYITLFDATPLHKANFIKLVNEGFYDSTTFHRVIDNFMIQGGDPNSKNDNTTDDGQGGPGYTIPAEFVDSLTHVRGAVAAARIGGEANPEMRSSGSQFYIVENHDGTHFLDGQYTVFGQVVQGLDVPDKICMQGKGAGDRPINNIYMKAEVVVIPEN